VHCDTPLAILNDIEGVARIARSFGVITVVDAVSTVGGLPIEFDSWGLDVLIGGSQKALNTPPGLTIMVLSPPYTIYIQSSPPPRSRAFL
jgi:alanine-glyoxylate transaminase/serine-glyoxylate transaminase/serine-pyruvate transaminase